MKKKCDYFIVEISDDYKESLGLYRCECVCVVLVPNVVFDILFSREREEAAAVGNSIFQTDKYF